MHSPEEMAKAGCTSVRGIRHWETLGLLGEVARTTGDQRRYTDEQLRRAKIIAAGQFGGFDLDVLKPMIEAYDVDVEVYEALTTRLHDQIRAAARLGENLPLPAMKKAPLVEYDL